jgi:hypothetical protein
VTAVPQTTDFISQVPNDVLKRTEISQCGSIVMFKPTVYMGGVTFNVSDYHIVIPSEMTPDALINNKMIHGDLKKIMTVNPGDTISCYQNSPAKPYYSILVKSGLFHKIACEMDITGEIRFENVTVYSFDSLKGFSFE